MSNDDLSGSDHAAEIYRSILHRTTAQYLTVRPAGIEVEPDRPLLRRLVVRLIGHGAARTLYRSGRPACRSLDGIASITSVGQRCACCISRDECTPQVRVELVLEGRSYRLLLAYTSGRNFLTYITHLLRQRRDFRDRDTVIHVVSRGTWGELRFQSAPRER